MAVLQKSTAQDLAVMSNGTYNTGKGQAFDDYLWDTLLFPSSAREIQFFKTNTGSQYGAVAGDQKTEIETSMDDTGKLPAGQSFLISGITISLIANTAINSSSGVATTEGQVQASLLNAFKNVINHSVWEIKFSNTEYSWRDSGSIFLPSVFEPAFFSGASSQGGIGNFSHFNWIKVSTKVPVSEQVNFSVRCTFNSGKASLLTNLNNSLTLHSSANVEMRCQLKGMLLRKV